MDRRRLRPADYLIGIAGVLVIVFLFAPWYTVVDGTVNGWQAFKLVDVWFALVGIMAITTVVITLTRDSPSLPVAFDVLTTTVTLLAIPLVVWRLLTLPGNKALEGHDWGSYAGAIAVFATLVGAWWAMRDESAPGMRPHAPVRTMPTPLAGTPLDPS